MSVTDILAELKRLADRADDEETKFKDPDVERRIDAFMLAVEQLDAVFSGSWFGWHSRTYLEGFRPRRPGEKFDACDYGMLGDTTRGRWVEYPPETVTDEIERRAGAHSAFYHEMAEAAQRVFEDIQAQSLPLLDALAAHLADEVIAKKKAEIVELRPFVHPLKFIGFLPGGMVRDRGVMSEGRKVPWHLMFRANLNADRSTGTRCRELAMLVRHITTYVATRYPSEKETLMKPPGPVTYSMFVCEKGHPVSFAAEWEQEEKGKVFGPFCPTCQAPVLRACPGCSAQIPGVTRRPHDDFINLDADRPNGCAHCGKRFPWATKEVAQADGTSADSNGIVWFLVSRYETDPRELHFEMRGGPQSPPEDLLAFRRELAGFNRTLCDAFPTDRCEVEPSVQRRFDTYMDKLVEAGRIGLGSTAPKPAIGRESLNGLKEDLAAERAREPKPSRSAAEVDALRMSRTAADVEMLRIKTRARHLLVMPLVLLFITIGAFICAVAFGFMRLSGTTTARYGDTEFSTTQAAVAALVAGLAFGAWAFWLHYKAADKL